MLRALVGVGALAAALTLSSAPPASADGGLLAWPKDRVYVVDHTNASWPVASVIERLDDHSPLDLVRVTRCPGKHAQCVDIVLGHLPGDEVGRTDYSYRGHDLVSAKVVLDRSWGRSTSAHNRRADICHEVGHAVGLPHVHRTSSCMNAVVADDHADHLDAAGYRRLRAMY